MRQVWSEEGKEEERREGESDKKETV